MYRLVLFFNKYVCYILLHLYYVRTYFDNLFSSSVYSNKRWESRVTDDDNDDDDQNNENTNQRHIQSPVKHLRWRLLRNQVTPFSHKLFLQEASS